MGSWGYPWGRNRNPLAIPPGSLRDEIQIQAPPTSAAQQDEYGGQIPADWTTVLTCMAKVETLTSREAYQTGQFSSQLTHKVTIYWPGPGIAIAGGMRILFGSRTFLIQVPENVQERNRVLHLMCLEINGAQ